GNTEEEERSDAARKKGQLKEEMINRVYEWTRVRMDPAEPIILFSRRMAEYKRLAMTLHDEIIYKLLRARVDGGLGMQYLIAGIPYGSYGMDILNRIDLLRRQGYPIVYVPDYDVNLEVNRVLLSGADFLFHIPQRPYEASGTSYQMAAFNETIPICSLDGGPLEHIEEFNEFTLQGNGIFIYEHADKEAGGIQRKDIRQEGDLDGRKALAEALEKARRIYDAPVSLEAIRWNLYKSSEANMTSERMFEEYYAKLYAPLMSKTSSSPMIEIEFRHRDNLRYRMAIESTPAKQIQRSRLNIDGDVETYIEEGDILLVGIRLFREMRLYPSSENIGKSLFYINLTKAYAEADSLSNFSQVIGGPVIEINYDYRRMNLGSLLVITGLKISKSLGAQYFYYRDVDSAHHRERAALKNNDFSAGPLQGLLQKIGFTLDGDKPRQSNLFFTFEHGPVIKRHYVNMTYDLTNNPALFNSLPAEIKEATLIYSSSPLGLTQFPSRNGNSFPWKGHSVKLMPGLLRKHKRIGLPSVAGGGHFFAAALVYLLKINGAVVGTRLEQYGLRSHYSLAPPVNGVYPLYSLPQTYLINNILYNSFTIASSPVGEKLPDKTQDQDPLAQAPNTPLISESGASKQERIIICALNNAVLRNVSGKVILKTKENRVYNEQDFKYLFILRGLDYLYGLIDSLEVKTERIILLRPKPLKELLDQVIDRILQKIGEAGSAEEEAGTIDFMADIIDEDMKKSLSAHHILNKSAFDIYKEIVDTPFKMPVLTDNQEQREEAFRQEEERIDISKATILNSVQRVLERSGQYSRQQYNDVFLLQKKGVEGLLDDEAKMLKEAREYTWAGFIILGVIKKLDALLAQVDQEYPQEKDVELRRIMRQRHSFHGELRSILSDIFQESLWRYRWNMPKIQERVNSDIRARVIRIRDSIKDTLERIDRRSDEDEQQVKGIVTAIKMFLENALVNLNYEYVSYRYLLLENALSSTLSKIRTWEKDEDSIRNIKTMLEHLADTLINDKEDEEEAIQEDGLAQGEG
ncbi:MAG: hypothetical protein KKD79_02180, partial [Candidatus Omnitrophica bacterium]|nr:hypothetical protein [Candidatus Omnitrophota bacterium]